MTNSPEQVITSLEEGEIQEIPEDDYLKSYRTGNVLAPKSRIISKRMNQTCKEAIMSNRRREPESYLLVYRPRAPGTTYEEVRRNIDENLITWSGMARGSVPKLVKVLDIMHIDEVRYVYGLFWGEREQFMERFVMMPHFLDFYGG